MNAKTSNSRRKITRRFATKVKHRGEERPVIAELDLDAGTIRVRLLGCRKRKTYNVADLAKFKPHTPQLGLDM
jgi:hypothetical protein